MTAHHRWVCQLWTELRCLECTSKFRHVRSFCSQHRKHQTHHIRSQFEPWWCCPRCRTSASQTVAWASNNISRLLWSSPRHSHELWCRDTSKRANKANRRCQFLHKCKDQVWESRKDLPRLLSERLARHSRCRPSGTRRPQDCGATIECKDRRHSNHQLALS